MVFVQVKECKLQNAICYQTSKKGFEKLPDNSYSFAIIAYMYNFQKLFCILIAKLRLLQCLLLCSLQFV